MSLNSHCTKCWVLSASNLFYWTFKDRIYLRLLLVLFKHFTVVSKDFTHLALLHATKIMSLSLLRRMIYLFWMTCCHLTSLTDFSNISLTSLSMLILLSNSWICQINRLFRVIAPEVELLFFAFWLPVSSNLDDTDLYMWLRSLCWRVSSILVNLLILLLHAMCSIMTLAHLILFNLDQF